MTNPESPTGLCVDAAAHATAEFVCRMTGYAGVEAQIVALRNANRQSAQSTQYMDWRYRTPDPAAGAEICWLDDAAQNAVGMAGLIPRRYWIDGRAESIAVLGDISVNEAQRGKGLGKLLLSCMTRHADARFPMRRNFVIPTEVARRVLRSLGWRDGGVLERHVLLLDPAPRLARKLKSDFAARAIAFAYRGVARALIRGRSVDARLMEVRSDFDAHFDEMWQAFDKRGLCIADRGAATLRWRYGSHPARQFRHARLIEAGRMTAYLVFEIEAGICTIYDVLGLTHAHVTRLLGAFLGNLFDQAEEVQVTLSDGHPYRGVFRSKGFMRRDSVAFLLHDPPGLPVLALPWVLTHGDKDI